MDIQKILNSILPSIEEEIQKSLPSETNSLWQNISFGKLNTAVKNEHINPLLEPTRSLVDLGGKRWRPYLLVLCALGEAYRNGRNLESAFETAVHLAPLVEFVHTASLIHDDIEDKSESRRGKPAAYLTYGEDVSINAASWLYFEAATVIDTLSCNESYKNQLYALYTRELRKLHLGQAMDIRWHNEKSLFPAEDEYMSMVKCKTGTLSSLAAKVGILAGGGSAEDADSTGSGAASIGAGFQIIDDVINVTSGNPGKDRGDDIIEGKKSLPVLKFIAKNQDDEEKIRLLEKYFEQAAAEKAGSSAIENAIKLLEESGSIEEAKSVGIELIHEGCNEFETFMGKDNPFGQQITILFKRMIPAAL